MVTLCFSYGCGHGLPVSGPVRGCGHGSSHLPLQLGLPRLGRGRLFALLTAAVAVAAWLCGCGCHGCAWDGWDSASLSCGRPAGSCLREWRASLCYSGAWGLGVAASLIA